MILAGMCALIWPFLPELPQVDYLVRRAKRGDLKAVFELCDRVFDGQVSSLNKMKTWFNHNSGMFWVIERVKRKAGIKQYELLGYFSILPLTRSAAELVQKEELAGAEFTTEHIVKPRQTPAAFYIGGIAGTGRRAKAEALGYLKARVLELEEAARENGDSAVFLTRPITSDGLRLMKKYDFYPVDATVAEALGRVHLRTEA